MFEGRLGGVRSGVGAARLAPRAAMVPGIAVLCLVVLCFPAPPAALGQGLDYRAPAGAPPSWGQFAKLVKYRFETWIEGDDEVAGRFRAWLKDNKADGLPPSLVVRAWLNPDGTVEKVSFPALKDARADADLRTILTRGNIGEAPPPDMLQPLSLSFTLNNNPRKPDR